MTISEIRNSDRNYLTPTDIAPIMEMNPQTVRMLARSADKALPFPVLVCGTRTKIPRGDFVRYYDEHLASGGEAVNR